MDELLEIVGEQVAAIVSHPLVVFAIQATVSYLFILWLASAFWVFRDLYRRTRDPISPYAAAGAVVLFTPLFFPLAILAYRLMRPATTIVERRAMALEADLLAREALVDTCPECGRRVHDTWSRCPSCGITLATDCPSCGERVGLDWVVCAWCAHDFEDPPVRPVGVMAEPARPRPAPTIAPALAATTLAGLPSARPR